MQEKRWNPEHYLKYSATQLGHAKDFIEKYSFSGTEKILDIGCGDGKITAALSQFIPLGNILGIDQSLEMIAFANRQFPYTELPNIRFGMQNATELNYVNQFDLIVSFSCLHYVKNDEQLKVMKNIRRALKPDGRLLLMLYRKCPAQWAAIDEISCSNRWGKYFKNFDPGYYEYFPESCQALLQKANLGQFNAIFTPPEYIIYENKEELSNFMKGWLPHLHKIPQKFHDDFMNEVVSSYLKNLDIKQIESLKIPFVRLLVY